MPRLTRSVFRDLAIWMAGFGILIGVVFPAFSLVLGVEAAVALSPHYLAACVAAGLLVGGVNWALARLVVGQRLALLAERMGIVADNVRTAAFTGNWLDCQAEKCRVEVDSTDEIGRSAHSFNELVDALAESHDVEGATTRFTSMLASELDVERVARSALEQLLVLSGAAAGAVLVVCEGEVSTRASQGLGSGGDLSGSGHVARAIRDRAVLLLDIPTDVLVDGALTSFRPRQVVVAPLVFKSMVVGVVVLAAAVEIRADGRRLLELLRPALALALNNAMAHERLQRLAAYDPLTDCYNRRFGLARLHEEFGRTLRTGTPLGLIMLDFDHFKQVNDTYGHVVGDRVLRAATATCRQVLRDGDVLLRYGGDELVAVLPGAGLSDAADIAERLRRATADTMVVDGERAVRVTASIGVASYPDQPAEAETDLLEHADAGMYEAKRRGRNGVAVCAAAGQGVGVPGAGDGSLREGEGSGAAGGRASSVPGRELLA